MWTNHLRPGRSRDAQEANHLFTEAKKLVENNQEISKALKLIRKGLLENPRSHLLYALRANIFSREGKAKAKFILQFTIGEGTLPWATPCLGPSRFF